VAPRRLSFAPDMRQGPRSWSVTIVEFGLAVWAACWALNRAAAYLLAALPVLVPVALVVAAGLLTWRFYSRRSGW
jgi:hypothetical protein